MKRIPPHLYQTVAEEATFGILVYSETGECLFINKAAVHLIGADQPTLQQLMPQESSPHLKNFSADLLKHDGFYHDILVQKVDTTTFIANIGAKHIEFDNQKLHLLMFQDVTLQKKLQREITSKQNEIKGAFEELLRQNQQLKELDLAKNRFIALTTHELRTPLSAMVASAEILKLKLYDTPEEMQDFVEMIHDQGLHLQELVNDILDFAKIQAGKMDFYIEQQDVVPMTEGLVHQYNGMAESNQVKMTFTKPGAPMICYFDDVRLRQILSNMLNNAIKYNRPGGQVTVHIQEEFACIKVLVHDTGKGMPDDQFDKVFNEFETIGQVALHHKGTGLGMPISRKLAQGMGGNLLFTSKLGVGSEFWIEIPKEKVLDAAVYQVRPEKTGMVAA